MGKKSKTKDKDKNEEEDEYIEEQTCNICFDTILFGYKKKDFQPDNSTACGNGHSFCMECINKIIKPERFLCNKNTNPHCCGFFYTCPICRMDACVDRRNIFAILKGSHRESRKQSIKISLENRQDVSSDQIDSIANQIFEALELNWLTTQKLKKKNPEKITEKYPP